VFGLFAPRCPLDTAEKAWVERRMLWLCERLGFDRMLDGTVVLPTDEFFPEPYHFDEASARMCLTRMCRYMRVDPASLALMVVPDEAIPGAAGLYEQARKGIGGRGSRSTVWVAASQLANPGSLLATLAHEIGHEILLGGGVLTDQVSDHEQITDLLTVFLGVGIFNANATLHESSWHYGATSSGWSIGRQGYLAANAFGYAMSVFAHVRGESSPAWARHLRADARGSLWGGLKYLRKTADTLLGPDTPRTPRPLPTPAQIVEGLGHNSPTFRIAALWELGWAGVTGPDLVPAVCRCLDDPDLAVRAEAARALAGFGPEAGVAMPRLLEIVQTQCETWTDALPTLVMLGAEAESVMPEVVRLLDTQPKHTELLARVARAYGAAALPAVPALLEAFGRQLSLGRGQVRELLAVLRELVPNLEGYIRKQFATDPDLLNDALWELRHQDG
jgi:hypothetical protein